MTRLRSLHAALCLGASWALGILLVSPPSAAQSPAKNPASEAFSACREQEKVGDARACWKVWINRFRSTGSEAETAYAEEHASLPPPGPPPPVVTPPVQPVPAAVNVTGPPGSATPAASAPPPPAEPVAGYARGDVLDFCAASTKDASTKQKLVVLAPADADQVGDDPQVRAVDGGRVVRDVFTARFPLARFDNIVTSLQSNRVWESATSLSVDEVVAFLRQPQPQSDPGRQARAERERDFVIYSLACTDYLVLPAITAHTVTHQAPIPGSASATSPLALKLVGLLGIWKRDGGAFRSIATISASVPGPADAANDAAVLATASAPEPKTARIDLASSAGAPSDLPGNVSAVPDARCLLGKVGQPGVSALGSCGPTGEGTVDQALGSIDERLGPFCREAARTGDPSDLVRCEVRARASQLARALGREAMGLERFRLYGHVALGQAGPTIALGRAEGVRVGQGFQVLDGSGDRIAYLKAVSVGPGGDAGKSDPTLLDLRSGAAPNGAWAQPYTQVGVVLTPYASFGALVLQSGTTSYELHGQIMSRGPPTTVGGGGGMVGFDLSSSFHWSETYLRVGVGALRGVGGDSTTVTLVPVDLWIEKGFYLARRLTLVTAIGATYEHLSVAVAELRPIFPDALHFSSSLFGPAARVGLSVMLHPSLSLSLEALSRIPVNQASYDADAFRAVPVPYQVAATQWEQRSDHFAMICGVLTLGWTF